MEKRNDEEALAERIRCSLAILVEAKRVRSLSPFPGGSGEPVAIAIEQIAHGCEWRLYI
jgi:hypothetical protein